MNKLNGFILFMVLVNLSWAAVTTINSPAQESTKICTEPGVHAHDSICQLYHECSSTGSADGSLHLVTKSCPERRAFNRELERCTLDISSCHPPVECSSKGVIADSISNSSYYLCQPRFTGSGFHIFHIHCQENEVFYPFFGICFADIEYLFEHGLPSLEDSPDMLEVTEDIQRMKREYKETIKKESAQKKLLKKEKKQVDKVAKSEEELLKQARNLEASRFKCETEGNFASQLGDNYYLACINNKSKLIAIPHICSLGAKFDPQTGTCVKSNSSQ